MSKSTSSSDEPSCVLTADALLSPPPSPCACAGAANARRRDEGDEQPAEAPVEGDPRHFGDSHTQNRPETSRGAGRVLERSSGGGRRRGGRRRGGRGRRRGRRSAWPSPSGSTWRSARPPRRTARSVRAGARRRGARAAGARRRVLRGGRLVGLGGRLRPRRARAPARQARPHPRRGGVSGASGVRASRPVGTGAYFAARSGVKEGRPPAAFGRLFTASPIVPRSPGRIGS